MFDWVLNTPLLPVKNKETSCLYLYAVLFSILPDNSRNCLFLFKGKGLWPLLSSLCEVFGQQEILYVLKLRPSTVESGLGSVSEEK